MNDPKRETTTVRCRRTEQDYDVQEHLRCPYCYGKKSEVEAGDRSGFCDFDPKHDPINFGFPPGSDRNERA